MTRFVPGWVGVGVLWLTSCGTSGSAGSPTGAGGESGGTLQGTGAVADGSGGGEVSLGGAGGTSVSSGAGGRGGAPAASSKTEACIATSVAQCERRRTCDPSTVSRDLCFQNSKDCPDAVFSPGSSRTIEGMVACAEAWKTFPCADLLAGKVPPCVAPGTRQVGEKCAYASQCASLWCLTSNGPCGVCAPRVGLGESCGGSIVCAFGLTCANGACADPSTVTPPPPPPPRKQNGEVCVYPADCVDDDWCEADASGVLRCVPFPAAGQSCAPMPGYCRDHSGEYCEHRNQELVCHARPGPGQPCGQERFGPPAICNDQAYCDPNAPGTPMCRAWPKVGEACEELVGATCAAGLACACATPACVTKQCLTPVAPGAQCGASAPNTACHPGSSCTNGTCTPIDSQGLFAQLCGP